MKVLYASDLRHRFALACLLTIVLFQLETLSLAEIQAAQPHRCENSRNVIG